MCLLVLVKDVVSFSFVVGGWLGGVSPASRLHLMCKYQAAGRLYTVEGKEKYGGGDIFVFFFSRNFAIQTSSNVLRNVEQLNCI